MREYERIAFFQAEEIALILYREQENERRDA